ncbi:hypothetical protein [Mycolicibacter virginiensis]|uniref:Uncharacterized protein n=1 Tax=Mycolicibacter virginiensis TaxID=1795032 RepID=A0A9X7INF0_9MYCO|nr:MULTISPECIES: hypothetical protein [Mycobacteriaceae]PQM52228.1 hypothetical protein C5U48_11255 [Mycolicibacter virginiensis]ULP46618.1 hypothetical protein MJO54_17660 [Mycolicibacter virginiensis]
MTERPDFDSAATDTTNDDTLPPSEATDSDELRNDDGDAAVSPPDDWQAADSKTAHESLDAKLAAEQPDVAGSDRDPDQAVGATGGGRHRAQVSGSPEDGDSFFAVEE